MQARDIAWRLAGILPLAMSVGTSLVHRSVLASAKHGPATLAELVLGLLSFTLASLGVLLLINGARLRDDWRRDLSRLDRSGEVGPAPSSADCRHDAAFIDFYLELSAPGQPLRRVTSKSHAHRP